MDSGAAATRPNPQKLSYRIQVSRRGSRAAIFRVRCLDPTRCATAAALPDARRGHFSALGSSSLGAGSARTAAIWQTQGGLRWPLRVSRALTANLSRHERNDAPSRCRNSTSHRAVACEFARQHLSCSARCAAMLGSHCRLLRTGAALSDDLPRGSVKLASTVRVVVAQR